MVRLLGLGRFLSEESPREISGREGTAGIGESGWLVRFFDSAFFCEWIAVSYLYKHEHSGVRDYLCNRMYTLPLQGIESYLFQICYMLVHKPSPSLDRFVIDVCSKSLKIALKVHWFLMAELEDTEDNEGISRIQEKCQIAATIMAEWPPILHQQTANLDSNSSPGSSKGNPVLNRILSSGQKLRSLASSPSFCGSPSREEKDKHNENASTSAAVGEVGGRSPSTSEENNLLKKLIPGAKVRDALFFRKSVEREDEDADKEGFFRRLMGDSKDKDMDDAEKDGFFKRFIRDSKDKEDDDNDKDGFFMRFVRDSKDKEDDDNDKDGFFKRFVRESKEDEEAGSSSDGFLKRLFREKEGKSREDEDKEGFFKRLFKDKHEEKNEEDGKGNGGNDEEESSDFLSFRRLFRVHPEDSKAVSVSDGEPGNPLDSSPGTENFFKRLFWDRDRSMEDAELLGSRKNKEKCPGSPKERDDKSHPKPPLPNTTHNRKDTYHDSLEFVQALCDTSYSLVEIFPMEDRKVALCESLMEINSTLAAAQNSGGICFPMGKGMHQVIHIPVDEAVLLNSRDKAPFLICVEVWKAETPSRPKETPGTRKVSRTGIPLANGDAHLPKPPPWAYPLWNLRNMNHHEEENMSRSTSEAIDQAMAHLWEAKVKLVHVTLSLENISEKVKSEKHALSDSDGWGISPVSGSNDNDDLEMVRVGLSAVPGVNMEDVSDPEPPRRKEHRRIPSTVAIEEVKVGL